tara:strand:+ start:477 stop:653 length:177 start_codon:yes stop_codon:yes gene_type:complete
MLTELYNVTHSHNIISKPIKTPTPRFDPQKRQSTTGYALMMAGGAVVLLQDSSRHCIE